LRTGAEGQVCLIRLAVTEMLHDLVEGGVVELLINAELPLIESGPGSAGVTAPDVGQVIGDCRFVAQQEPQQRQIAVRLRGEQIGVYGAGGFVGNEPDRVAAVTGGVFDRLQTGKDIVGARRDDRRFGRTEEPGFARVVLMKVEGNKAGVGHWPVWLSDSTISNLTSRGITTGCFKCSRGVSFASR